MNHLFRSRPHFLEIVNKQSIAYSRLHNDKTTRTPAERANLERNLQAVPLSDVDLPKIPLVRLKDSEQYDGANRWVVLGEVAQVPGKLILANVETGKIITDRTSEELELVPPDELA
jgi:hypothetical protein